MEVEHRARDSAPAQYRPRRPSQSVLYRTVQEHLATWLAQAATATTTVSVPHTSSVSSAVIWSAASSPTASPGPGVGSAGTTS